MQLLSDKIHYCKNCNIVKKYGEPCSSQDEIKSSACEECKLPYKCCHAPFLILMPCERNGILDEVNEDEYIQFDGMIPFNKKTDACKHFDTTNRRCKVYEFRPVACRIAGCIKTGGFI